MLFCVYTPGFPSLLGLIYIHPTTGSPPPMPSAECDGVHGKALRGDIHNIARAAAPPPLLSAPIRRDTVKVQFAPDTTTTAATSTSTFTTTASTTTTNATLHPNV